MPEAPSDDRKIERLKEPRNWIRFFRSQSPAPDQQQHKNRDDCDRQERGAGDRQSLGVGERTKHPALLRLQQEYREERNDDDQERKEQRAADLFRGLQQQVLPLRFFHF